MRETTLPLCPSFMLLLFSWAIIIGSLLFCRVHCLIQRSEFEGLFMQIALMFNGTSKHSFNCLLFCTVLMSFVLLQLPCSISILDEMWLFFIEISTEYLLHFPVEQHYMYIFICIYIYIYGSCLFSIALCRGKENMCRCCKRGMLSIFHTKTRQLRSAHQYIKKNLKFYTAVLYLQCDISLCSTLESYQKWPNFT